MPSAETSERRLLETVVARYKAEGFDVFIEPTPALLPPFMKDYRPHAVVIRPGKKIAIEIARSSSEAGEKIRRLREQFSQHDDWELLVLYVSPGAATEAIEIAPRDAIERAVQEVIELRIGGQQTAALVMGWSALEAIARALLPDQLSRPQPPNRLIETLASQGYLTPSEADSLRAAAMLRNAVAHGKLGSAVEIRQLDALSSALQTLKSFLPKNAA